MKSVIKEATRLASNMWDADAKDVIGNKCRKKNVIQAKRMLIYYLYNFVEVGHGHMKNHIKDLSHATSIHHVRKFNQELDECAETKQTFKRFMDEMKSFSIYGDEFDELVKEMEQIKVKLKSIKNEN